MRRSKILCLLFFGLLISYVACESSATENQTQTAANDTQNEKAFVETLEKHLTAVSNKDLVSLKSTMSPENKMQLILPGAEPLHTVDSFLQFHTEWFQDTTWTFETKILSTEIGPQYGIAITEIVYREPERDGHPYFNRMIVSYGLEKVDGQWYIIKDHASSVEKSTDNQ